MADSKVIDIRKTGPQGFRQIQQQNNPKSDDSLESQIEAIKRLNPVTSAYSPDLAVPKDIESPLQQQGDWWGSSAYDKLVVNEDEYENLGDLRAENQPWYSKWGSALGKLAGQVGTSIGKAAGMLYGIGEAIAEGDAARIFNNDVVNTFSEIDETLEKQLPNYRTQWEQEAPWWQRMGTANFWADDIVKNWGFTIGSLLTGNAWVGAARALGLVKGATSAKYVGSIMSALGEATIEANNNMHEVYKLESQKVDYELENAVQDIMDSDLSDNDKSIQIAALEQRANILKQEAQKRAESSGLTTFIGNTALLSLNNFNVWGNVFSRGFSNQAKVAGSIYKDAGKYVWNTITKKDARMRGLRSGLLEGNEEMSQAFISDYASNKASYDSPDSYYKALIDPQAQVNTKSTIAAIGEALNNTYLNPSRYEEGFAGMLMGLMGVPTFGKQSNSSDITWLGRGKTIGISGGFFGETANIKGINAEGEDLANRLNQSYDRIKNQANYFVQSDVFKNLQDGFSVANDAFEWHNARDNQDLIMFQRFAEAHKLDDLEEMINQDYENMSQEQLMDIALNTSPETTIDDAGNADTKNADGRVKISGWRDARGALLPSTAQGQEVMRQKLIERRDQLLQNMRNYTTSSEAIRQRFGNSLIEDQIGELTWLDWKIKAFAERFNSIKAGQNESINKIIKAIDAFQRGVGQGKANAVETAALVNVRSFLQAFQDIENPLQFNAFIKSKSSKDILNFFNGRGRQIIEGIAGFDSITYDNFVRDIEDVNKIAKTTKQFRDKLAEYTSNPDKLIENRKKLERKAAKKQAALQRASTRESLAGKDVSTIVKEAKSGEFNIDAAQSQIEEGGLEIDDDTRAKLDNAKGIMDLQEDLTQEILRMDTAFPPEIRDLAIRQLENSAQVAETPEEFADTETEAFNDIAAAFEQGGEALERSLTSGEYDVNAEHMLEQAKSLIEKAKGSLEERMSASKAAPDIPSVSGSIDSPIGHDPIEANDSANKQKREKERAEAARTARNELNNKINALIEDASQSVEAEDKDAFKRVANEIKAGILEGSDNDDIEAVLLSMDSLQDLLRKYGEPLQLALGSVLHRIRKLANQENPQTKEDTSDDLTPIITEEDLNDYSENNSDDVLNAKDADGDIEYNYWKPTATYLPKHNEKGNTTPYYEIAQTLPNLSEQQKKRIYAIGKYLEQHGAFNRVNFGENLQPGDTIGFAIDASLNKAAGEVIILMVDKNGNPVGDVMSKTLSISNRQKGLTNFIDAVNAEYEAAGSPAYFRSRFTTTVEKNMVGKIPYTENSKKDTLNKLFRNFKLAIAVNEGSMSKMLAEPGRRRNDPRSDFEDSILPPKNAKKGQPYLLLKTSDNTKRRQWVPVPFIMARYNAETANTALGRALQEEIENLVNFKGNNPIRLIEKLRNLLAVDWHVDLNKVVDADGAHWDMELFVSKLKTGKEERAVREKVYEGRTDQEGVVSQILSKLQSLNLPFQVSRRYINGDYGLGEDAQDYNRMIGEVASTNLQGGEAHTVNEWFTVKPIDVTNFKPSAKQTTQSTKKDTPKSKTLDRLSKWYLWQKQHISFDKKGHKYYLDGKPIDYSVTELGDVVLGKPDIQGDYSFAQSIGNSIDAITRDFFSKNGVPANKKYPNLSDERKQQVLNDLNRLKDHFNNVYGTDEKGNALYYVLTADDYRLAAKIHTTEGTKTVAGTPDMFVIDKDGDVHIYDMKAKNHPITQTWNGEEVRDRRVYTFQLNTYRQILETVIPELKGRVKDLNLIWFNQSYPKQYKEATYTTNEDTGVVTVTDNGATDVLLENYEPWTTPALEDNIKDSLIPLVIQQEINTVLPIDSKEETVADDAFSAEELEGFDDIVSAVNEEEATASLDERAKTAGLLCNKRRKELWEVLKNNQKEALLNLSGQQQKTAITILENTFSPKTKTFDTKMLGGPATSFLKGILFRKSDNEQYKPWNAKKEKAWIKKVLPQIPAQDRLRIVNAVKRIARNGKSEVVWGQFENGIITIYNGAAQGTGYHEAFHFVAHTLLTEDELNTIFEEAAEKWKGLEPIALEENLAEDFRRYVQLEETPILGKAVKIYRKLANLIANIFNRRSAIKQLYYNISQGKMADREVNESREAFYRSVQAAISEAHQREMQEIKDKAIADGTFMKAPNGKPTNLTERQWLQVRTKAFKRWFGDWEIYARINKDSEEYEQLYRYAYDFGIENWTEDIAAYIKANNLHYPNTEKEFDILSDNYIDEWKNKNKITSKIVDYNGEPLVVYHVTKDSNNKQIPFSVFKTTIDYYGRERPIGAFFTTDLEYAKSLAKFKGIDSPYIFSVFLNIRKPYNFGKELDTSKSNSIFEGISSYYWNYRDEKYDGIVGHDKYGPEHEGRGLIKSKGTEYVVEHPNQIKSATDNNGDFSLLDDDIYYRLGGDALSTTSSRQDKINFLRDYYTEVLKDSVNKRIEDGKKFVEEYANRDLRHISEGGMYNSEELEAIRALRESYKDVVLSEVRNSKLRIVRVKSFDEIMKEKIPMSMFTSLSNSELDSAILNITNDEYEENKLPSTAEEMEDIFNYHQHKDVYSTLLDYQKDYLESIGVTPEEFRSWTVDEQEHFKECL